MFWPLARICTHKCYTPPKIGHFWKNHIMPIIWKLTGGWTIGHEFQNCQIFWNWAFFLLFDLENYHDLTSLMYNRGVEIGHKVIKNWIKWFYATNASRTNILIVWENKVCLYVIVTFVKMTPKQSIMLCRIPWNT